MSFACRSCGGARIDTILSLGRTPLANALLTREQLDQPEATYPLDLVFCSTCTLVQITETVPPEVLFREYVYFSSFAETTLRCAEELAQRLIASCNLGPESLVMEIASNDGYLLRHYRKAGVPVLGIEPARNIAKVASEEHGIPTLAEFFGRVLAEELARRGQHADVMHANNVLAHVPDLNGVVHGVREVLKEGGVAVIEVPYLLDMIERVEFDTIYHEHLCYFSLTALARLFARHGLAVTDVERLSIHGGSLRLMVRHAAPAGTTARVREMLDAEAKWGVADLDRYRTFGARIERLRQDLSALLADLRSRGERIAAYGASAKGSTLLNYFGFDGATLDFVVDRSTVKQGRFTPGSRLPIRAPETLLAEMPQHVLLLTWNFKDEILAQQAEYRRRGGKFIIPIPELMVV